MKRCPACGRHHRAAESACPFCGRAAPVGRVTRAALACMSSMVLMACYGAPPGSWETGDTSDLPVDADADGYDSSVDCDDSDATIHPETPEVCDDAVDNDCDGKIDGSDDECAGG